jgi:hypothetical protein
VADDLVLNVKQIASYPLTPSVGSGDVALIQKGGLGGPYASMLPADLVGTALANGGTLHLMAGFGLAWNGASLTSDGISFSFSGDVQVPSLHSAGDIFVAGNALATQVNVDQLFDTILENSVFSFNGRTGNVQLETDDVLRAGGAPIRDAHFGGFNTSPTPWDFRANDDQIATTAFVQAVITQLLCGGSVVTSFNGRGGDVTLSTADVNAAYANYPNDLIVPTAPNPALGDASNRIATTLFVDESLDDLRQDILNFIASGGGVNLSAYALLASPNFTGVPTAPTAALGSSTGQLATTAFVQNAVTASTTGVASFNTRTGAVVLLLADVTGAGGAPLANPTFTGNPQAPTAAPGDNDTSIATTAFVHAAIAALPAAPVTSFNTRTGAIVLSTADITGAGGAASASPALTGVPTAPTATAGTSTTQLATTAFVAAAIATLGSSVTSFNGRSGAVSLIANDISAAGGALLAAPAFTGAPTAPTATSGTNTTQLATTAFVQAAITAIPANVSSFNTRTGAVTLTTADITGAGGAPAASPAFSGVPTAPTPVTASNDTTVATTSFVKSAIAAGGVSSFNSRTGAVTLNSSDISAVGGALLASPGLTGVPTAPTAVAGTNTSQLATTQFVTSALASAGGVTSFNSRAGTVTLTSADVTAASQVPQRFVQAAAGSGTYTTPAGALYLDVIMTGAGAGGQNGNAASTGSTNGTNTTFGAALTAGGGSISGGAGAGTATGGDINLNGSIARNYGNTGDSVSHAAGAPGAGSYWGPGGTSGPDVAGANAVSPGAGGGGGGTNAATAGSNPGGTGGYSGATVIKRIAAPLASYAWTVGAGGTGASVGSTGFQGGNGAPGILMVDAHFQ